MGTKFKAKYKVIRMNKKLYRFLLWYFVLAAAVVAGTALMKVLIHFGVGIGESIISGGGIARAIELMGEAGADAVDDY